MAGFAVTPDRLDQVASVLIAEADVAIDALATFETRIQALQDQYQPVPSDDWLALMSDLFLYTAEYYESLQAMAAGLRRNSANYSDIEQLNAHLVSVDGYTPITDHDMAVWPRMRIQASTITPSDLGITVDGNTSGATQEGTTYRARIPATANVTRWKSERPD